MSGYKTETFPKSRIATIDICEMSRLKHHVTGFIELDVTETREKIRRYKREKGKISFTAWLVKAISLTVRNHESVAAYPGGKRRIVIFDDINVSLIVEKKIAGQRVPIPLVIEKADKRTIESITQQISDAQNEQISEKDIVLQAKSTRAERLYYHLPGFARRMAWRYMMKRPSFLFSKMGNVAITSLGMMGSVNGWFIPRSIHPVCFGISSIIRKPVVADNTICIREMMNMTIMIDHDVIDGAPVARFLNDLSDNIRKGAGL
ncbi:MAG: 2-oxo acid dehydrogenase subunit E2 [Bacteroidales bacterium]|nr:2-oxo acid dehydrogenase subunit E2 [Bacteroidales bacterium]